MSINGDIRDQRETGFQAVRRTHAKALGLGLGQGGGGGGGSILRSRRKEEKGAGSMVTIKNLDVILSQKEGIERLFHWKRRIGVWCLLSESLNPAETQRA